MSNKSKSKLLHLDHKEHGRGTPLLNKKRAEIFQTKKLLAIAAIIGTLLYPHKMLEKSESNSSFQYGVIFGNSNQSHQTLQESRCAQIPLSPQHTKASPNLRNQDIVGEALLFDKPPQTLPPHIQNMLALHLKNLEEITAQITGETLEGRTPTPAIVADRLQTIRKTSSYFQSKNLPSLTLYSEAAMGELLNNTSRKTLQAAETLLKQTQKRPELAGPTQ